MKNNTDLAEVPSAAQEPKKAKPGPVDGLRALRLQALSLVEHLQALAPGTPKLTPYISVLQELTNFEEKARFSTKSVGQKLSHKQLQEFGKLLRDKRNKAGFSRVHLARKAKLSAATIKFIETAKHPPSRATLIRLISVEELHLTWDDVPGQPVPPAAEHVTAAAKPVGLQQLNCFVAPSWEPVREVAALVLYELLKLQPDEPMWELLQAIARLGGHKGKKRWPLSPTALMRGLMRLWAALDAMAEVDPLVRWRQQLQDLFGSRRSSRL